VKFLLFASIFLLPFNGLPILSLGLIGKQGAFYALVPLLLLWILRAFLSNRNRITVDKRFFKLACLLLSWVCLSFTFNSQLIAESSYLGRVGTTRFIEQLLQLTFGIVVAMAIADQVKSKDDYIDLIGVIRSCLLFVLIFGCIQALGYGYGGALLDLQVAVGSLILPDTVVAANVDAGGRIHSVSQEPSMLSGYLVAVAPFVISFSVKRRQFLLPVFIALVLLATASRIGYVVFFLQMFILLVFYRRKSISIYKAMTFTPFFLIITLVIMQTPAGEIVRSLFTIEDLGSNATRYAGLVSGVLVWLDNSAIFGVGLGQYGYYAAEYMPDWGLITHETQAVFAGEKWPYTHNMYITLLTEIGVVGLFLFSLMLIGILNSINSLLRENIDFDEDIKLIGYSSFVSLFGTMLTLLSREPLSNFNLWMSVGLALMFMSVARRSMIRCES